MHPDDLDRLVDYWRSILASGETGEIEARIRRYDGEYRWFLFRADPLRDESGTIVKWYGTNVDIEDRKRAEQLQAELDRSKQLRQIVDAIPQMIAVLNPDGTPIYANQTTLDYTGLTITEVMSGDFRDRAFHPDDVARLRSEL
jgi:PAS domain-containing protein